MSIIKQFFKAFIMLYLLCSMASAQTDLLKIKGIEILKEISLSGIKIKRKLNDGLSWCEFSGGKWTSDTNLTGISLQPENNFKLAMYGEELRIANKNEKVDIYGKFEEYVIGKWSLVFDNNSNYKRVKVKHSLITGSKSGFVLICGSKVVPAKEILLDEIEKIFSDIFKIRY